MSRYTILLGVILACSCGEPDEESGNQPGEPEPVVEPAASISAFRFDETKRIIFLDTRIPPGQRRQFGIGLGSITLKTLRVEDGTLTIHYTPEVEGGYTIYECTIPVSPKPVEFRINSDGTPGTTSFDLAACRVVRRGNVLLDP